MVTSKSGRALLAILVSGIIIGLVGAGCGNTDGGKAADGLGPQNQFVADGGAGAQLLLRVLGKLTVGGRVRFDVQAIDPQGLPLAFIRIACDTEEGVAILEPISPSGLPYEHTNENGYMSGLLGGVLPGSFIIECRAPVGFGLVARKSLVVTGSGSAEFEGSAGGNIGGGVVVEPVVEEEEETELLRISGIDAGASSNVLARVVDDGCQGLGAYTLTVQNESSESVYLTNVTAVDGVNSSSGALSTEIGAKGSGVVSVQAPGAGSLEGESVVSFTLNGVTASGGDFSLTKSALVTVDSSGRCN